MSRQSVDEQPQTHVLTLRGGDAPAADRQLTQFPHPYPTLRGLQVEPPDDRGPMWAIMCFPASEGVLLLERRRWAS